MYICMVSFYENDLNKRTGIQEERPADKLEQKIDEWILQPSAASFNRLSNLSLLIHRRVRASTRLQRDRRVERIEASFDVVGHENGRAITEPMVRS
ncbi:uncharacterized protein C8R40DRAFT_1133002 [Lentinula edodes]|uniref:uncharacterized protein n=1 Tax=Lentinula edodes TaxID=5353 RepID=UPI001E8CE27B|nr:uncharacterized protein C8R40DRAFT_1133002 [Lentinula edodes]KAH7868846.1 hypothetical protein C8R40DRAFT_1133002 [Lentinula edodes]